MSQLLNHKRMRLLTPTLPKSSPSSPLLTNQIDFILQELNVHNSQLTPEVLTPKGFSENHRPRLRRRRRQTCQETKTPQK
jgi:hypothetical protein